MINKRGGKVGPQRANRQRFPYEPRVVGGRLLMPAELQAIHQGLGFPIWIGAIANLIG